MQASLFDQGDHPDQCVEHVLQDAKLLEYPRAFNAVQSDALFNTLLTEIPWQQEYLRIAGKLRAVPRLQCWMGDKASLYGYSGVRLTPCPWNKTVSDIHARIGELTGKKFNSVLINYYRNGQDSVAWHADDEAELGKAAVIASVSLGAERKFQLKHKHTNPPHKYQLQLRNGSLLLMGETLQQNWLHQLPKMQGLDQARINLTFRNIVSIQQD